MNSYLFQESRVQAIIVVCPWAFLPFLCWCAERAAEGIFWPGIIDAGLVGGAARGDTGWGPNRGGTAVTGLCR